jgi:hypothetical protein
MEGKGDIGDIEKCNGILLLLLLLCNIGSMGNLKGTVAPIRGRLNNWYGLTGLT